MPLVASKQPPPTLGKAEQKAASTADGVEAGASSVWGSPRMLATMEERGTSPGRGMAFAVGLYDGGAGRAKA